MSVGNFKQEHNVSSIEIIRNPNNGRLFFRSPEDSTVSGAVSKNYSEDPVMTEVTGTEENAESFWLLHKRGTGGQDNVLDTL